MKKRLAIKCFAILLAITFMSGAIAPSAVLARRPPPPPRPHHHHGWDSDDTWRLVGALGLIGYLASQQKSTPSYSHTVVDYDYTPVTYEYHPVVTYESVKAEFIRKMDKKEKLLWLQINEVPPGEYCIEYSRESTARRVKKFSKTLYKDIEFVRNDEENNTVYFNKLSEAEK